MGLDSIDDLSEEDLVFLEAIRDIERAPERYGWGEGDDPSDQVKPANTSSIKDATELSSSQVRYRLGANSEAQRGFEDAGLIETQSPKLIGGSLSPWSVKLTEKGYDWLERVDRSGVSHHTTQVEELNQRIETIETELTKLTSFVDEIEEQAPQFDRVDAPIGYYVGLLLARAFKHNVIFEDLMELPIDQFNADDPNMEMVTQLDAALTHELISRLTETGGGETSDRSTTGSGKNRPG